MEKIFYKIGYNTLVQILGKGISVILGFISVGLLTRYLGQEGFGNFNLAFAYFSFFGTIADWGLQLTMVRELAKKENLPKEIYGTYFWLKLILVVFSTLLAIFCLLFFPYSKFLKIGIIFASLGAAVGVLNSYGTVIFQANLRLDLVTLVDLLAKIFTTGLIALFVFLKFGFYSIINSILIGNLASTFMIIFLLKKFITYDLSFNFKLAKNLITKSLTVGFISVLSLLYFKVDTIILSLYRGAEEIGIYSLAYKILENILVLWGFYIASVYPILSKFLKESKKNKVKFLLEKSIKLGVGFGIIIFILGWIISPSLIEILGGERFKRSVIVLRLFLLGLPLFFSNNLFYHTFLSKGEVALILKVVIISFIFNLTLNLFLIPKWGYFAASLNTILTQVCLTFLYAFLFKNFSLEEKQ